MMNDNSVNSNNSNQDSNVNYNIQNSNQMMDNSSLGNQQVKSKNSNVLKIIAVVIAIFVILILLKNCGIGNSGSKTVNQNGTLHFKNKYVNTEIKVLNIIKDFSVGNKKMSKIKFNVKNNNNKELLSTFYSFKLLDGTDNLVVEGSVVGSIVSLMHDDTGLEDEILKNIPAKSSSNGFIFFDTDFVGVSKIEVCVVSDGSTDGNSVNISYDYCQYIKVE